MMKQSISFLVLFLLLVRVTPAQVSVSTNGAPPDASAILDLQSNNMGLMIPRITTTGRNAIPSPATGLMIYNTTSGRIELFNGVVWTTLTSSPVSGTTGSYTPAGGMVISNDPGIMPAGGSILDIHSSTRGLLLPRTTPGQITNPAAGLVIFNTSVNRLACFTGSGWVDLCSVSLGAIPPPGAQSAVGVAINTSGESPHHSAMIDLGSSNRGLLLPRLTQAVRDILLPPSGLIIYNTSAHAIEFYNGIQWNRLTQTINPAITIQASENPVWTGTVVDFFALIVNGGNSPILQWKVNGINAGGNSQFFSYTPVDQDTITCTLTSSDECAGTDPVVSQPVIMRVISPCPGIPAIQYLDKTYHTVQIGDQCWLRENMDVGLKIGKNEEQTNNGIVEKYCYDNNDANCNTYGGLYQWGEVVQYLNGASNTTTWNPPPAGYVQGICPGGWHIPSDNEWISLVSGQGGIYNAGCKLKEAGLSHWSGVNYCATNASGLTVLPGGARYNTGFLFGLGWYTEFWTSTEGAPDHAWNHYLERESGRVYHNINGKKDGYSVRCMKNEGYAATLPIVSTATPTTVTANTAHCGGVVMDDGGTLVTERGVCFSTTPDPTISSTKVVSGYGTGSFDLMMTGLTPSTLYFVRAFATNAMGTAYGEQSSFTTTGVSVPVVITTAASSITPVSAVCGGEVISNGGLEVTSRGICYGTDPDPTINGSYIGTGSGNGIFSGILNGLNSGTVYHIRAYATNAIGTAYGDDLTFTTLPPGRYIGESYGGGIVFYIDWSGEHGLIAAETNQSLMITWGCPGTLMNCYGNGVGQGWYNTELIVAGCSTPDIAARICYDLELNGFLDWYLPSIYELEMMYQQQSVIGGFDGEAYWSSSEYDGNYAAVYFFTQAMTGYMNKNELFRVRAIRQF